MQESSSWSAGPISTRIHPKLGWMRILGNIELFRRVQYTVRYRLNPAP